MTEKVLHIAPLPRATYLPKLDIKTIMNTYKTPTISTMKNSCTLLAIFLAISTQLIVAHAQDSEGFISEGQNENAAIAHEENIAQEHKIISRVKRMGELDEEELFVDDMDTADSQHYPVSVSFFISIAIQYLSLYVCL